MITSEAEQEGPGPGKGSGWTAWLHFWGIMLVLGGLLWLLLRKIDLLQFKDALMRSDYRLVALAAAVNLVVTVVSAVLRLWILLRPLPHTGQGVRFQDLLSVHLASSAVHNLLPSPAGDVVRTMQLHRRHGYRVGHLLASYLVEKVIEASGLALEMLLVAALLPLPRGLDTSIYVLALLSAGGAALFMALAWRYRPAERDGGDRAAGWLGTVRRQVRSFMERLGEGMHLLLSLRVWVWSLFWSVAADLTNALTVGLCSWAVGARVPLSGWFLAMLVARLSGVLPSTPGQFGVMEAGVVLALSLLGVPNSQALAIALLYHAAHFVPVTLAGLFEVRRWR